MSEYFNILSREREREKVEGFMENNQKKEEYRDTIVLFYFLSIVLGNNVTTLVVFTDISVLSLRAKTRMGREKNKWEGKEEEL